MEPVKDPICSGCWNPKSLCQCDDSEEGIDFNRRESDNESHYEEWREKRFW